MSSQGSARPGRRWWSPALLVHALLVLVVAVALPLTATTSTRPAVAGLVSAAELVLGMPWWLLTGLFYLLPGLVPGASGRVGEAVVSLLPVLVNLFVHAAVLRAVRARRRRPGGGAGRPDVAGAGLRRPGPALGVGAALGAAVWGAWLGWDRTASYDVVTGQVESLYVTLQVLGCALTVGVVTAVLAARSHPVLGAAGVGFGFWAVWTLDAGSQDDTGLFAVGSVMLAVGLALGVSMAAQVGCGLRDGLRRLAARRASR